MGVVISKIHKLYEGFSHGNPARIVMLGLDAAGKTTILYKLKLNENICTIPTIGFNVETVQPYKGVSFTVWDVGGQAKIRRLWEYYFQNTEGLLFVVDSADSQRVHEAREELFALINNEQMNGVPVVVIANKQDLPGALRPHELVEGLELRKITDRKWHIQGTCATNGDGLYEALETLSGHVKELKKSRKH